MEIERDRLRLELAMHRDLGRIEAASMQMGLSADVHVVEVVGKLASTEVRTGDGRARRALSRVLFGLLRQWFVPKTQMWCWTEPFGA